MRRLIVVVTALTVVTAGLALAAGWRISTVDSTGSVGKYSSLALDSKDHGHIAYLDFTSSSNPALKYAYYNGSSWALRVIDRPGGEHCSLCVDSKDRPHICYHGWVGTTETVKYAHYDGSTWKIEAPPVVGAMANDYKDIDTENNDRPCILYRGTSGTDRCYMLWYDGTAWKQGRFAEYCDKAVSVFITPDGRWHGTWCDTFLRYKYQDKNPPHGWVTAPAIEYYTHMGGYVSLAVDSSDNAHLSWYYSYSTPPYVPTLKYSFYNGSTWAHTDVQKGNRAGEWNSLALHGTTGYPRIAYTTYTDRISLKYASYNGTTWNTETVDSSYNVGDSCSLALNSKNNPHIAYHDQRNADLKYAYWDPNLGVDLVSFTATPKEAGAVALRWDVRCTEGEEVLGFNLYRQGIAAVNTTSAGEGGRADAGYQKINRELITGRNPYAYADAAVIPGKRYEYRLEAVLSANETSPLGTVQAGGRGARPGAFGIVALSPNPTANVINCKLQLGAAGQVELALYDLAGRRVKATTATFGEAGIVTAPVEVAALAPGVYILKASANGASASARAVVTR